MARPILVGYDGTADDRAPVEFGIAASEFTGAPLIVGTVHASAAALGPSGEGLVEEQLADGPGESLDHLGKELRRQGVGVECRALPGTSAARALHEAAEEFGAGMLVVGSTDRGTIGHLVPGSTGERLMHGAPCPVAVVPRSWKRGDGLRTLGVAYVETPEGRRALADAFALARRSGAKLRVLHAAKPRGLSGTFGGGDAMTPATTYEELASAVRVRAERAVDEATAGQTGVDVDPDVSVGDPADFLIAASERLDLLICGSRGYGPVRAVLLGGVTRRVATEAHCPVIVLARGAETGLEALVDEQTGATASEAARRPVGGTGLYR
jgi:nucleotide-binding universal stress UspA family protein